VRRAAAGPAASSPASGTAGARAEVVVEVDYRGDDLADTAAMLGVSPEHLVARHTATAWRVAFIGFAPGFAYLAADDWPFDVPRLDVARTRVPGGAVGLAAGFSGAYPRESPGGWRLVGRTDAALWDPHADPPALLAPGRVVRFRAVGP
jgi:KipI family sensor histidine kinase inhibitor